MHGSCQAEEPWKLVDEQLEEVCRTLHGWSSGLLEEDVESEQQEALHGLCFVEELCCSALRLVEVCCQASLLVRPPG